MAFGVYIHIPYCLQKCRYCDFAVYLKSQTVDPEHYVDSLAQEIRLKAASFSPPQKLTTLYFGGGTPSLLAPRQLVKVIEVLVECGFSTSSDTEITLEINPGTLTPKDVEALLYAGFNRFSVGVQTFREDLLKLSGRLHSTQDSRRTLELLLSMNVNYSADILFALPHQTIDDLRRDLDEILGFKPNHISPYCLTVAENHPMAKNRRPDEEQAEMFDLIADVLQNAGLERYEVSNFAKPGFQSRHNNIYWSDQPYWGVGLSAHSYLPKHREWGARFWNPRTMESYLEHLAVIGQKPWRVDEHPGQLLELLKKNQSMTDFCHTSLRTRRGLSGGAFENKFQESLHTAASEALGKNQALGLLEEFEKGAFRLTKKGIVLSDQVFLDFTFLPETSSERGHASDH